ncbi:MAG: hypothetical protein VX250_11440 [Planctomycetota bacterium]|nr:hypothetical protein [Planctomycetota bacterium]
MTWRINFHSPPAGERTCSHRHHQRRGSARLARIRFKKTSYLELGDELKTGVGLRERACDALDRFTSRAYSAMEAKN